MSHCPNFPNFPVVMSPPLLVCVCVAGALHLAGWLAEAAAAALAPGQDHRCHLDSHHHPEPECGGLERFACRTVRWEARQQGSQVEHCGGGVV